MSQLPERQTPRDMLRFRLLRPKPQEPIRDQWNFQPERKLPNHRNPAFACANGSRRQRCWPLSLADALDQDSPLDTLVQNHSLPTIRAAMKLNSNDPVGAISALQPSLKYELSYNPSFNSIYPAYIRGLAYLQLGGGRSAVVEFQKFVDHRGLVGRDVIGALAHLQMARAQKMMSDEASARKWYEDFLALWQDADSDIPIYQQAKAEYAKLRR
jgi:eukaryotic-like serine/threonine-protein kinase